MAFDSTDSPQFKVEVLTPPVTVLEGARRLRVLAAALEKLDEEQELYTQGSFGEIEMLEDNSCKTAACSLGWAAIKYGDSWGINYGWEVTEREVGEDERGTEYMLFVHPNGDDWINDGDQYELASQVFRTNAIDTTEFSYTDFLFGYESDISRELQADRLRTVACMLEKIKENA